MKITRSRKHHVSMGNYEFMEFGAEVTYESDEEVEPDEIDAALSTLLEDDLAAASSLTAEEKSYVHDYTTGDK